MRSHFPIATFLFFLGFILTGITSSAQFESKAEIARALLSNLSLNGSFANSNFEDMKVSSETFSKTSRLNHVYFQQYFDGVPVHNAILGAHIKADNTLFSQTSTFINVAEGSLSISETAVTHENAIRIASKHFGYIVPTEFKIKNQAVGKNRKTVYFGGDVSQDAIPVELIWLPLGNATATLCWQVQIHEPNGANYWSVRIDANSGEVLDKHNMVITCSFGISEAKCNHSEVEHNIQRTFMPPTAFKEEFSQEMEMLSPADGSSYRVFREPAESPIHTSTVSPADGRTIAVEPAHPVASPFGWHDTDGVAGAEFTITRGNNTHAYTDLDANDIPDPGTSPDGGAGLDFNTPLDLTMGPTTYRPSAVVNLFYWNNYMHDFAHKYGFDEASGNFQVNNYGRGGTGGDDVRAEAQDGSATNNATFLTLPEGQRPRMHMFVWTNTNPNRDSDFDNGIIAHEYAHGISTRLAGGPATTACLSGQEQMGEGWSDYYSLMTTSLPTDVANTPRGIGTYVLGQPTTGAGIRPRRYTPDMTVNEVTYDFIKTASIPHGVGFVWATMLWDLTWALRDRHGFTLGTDLSVNLVNQGLKLQVCNAGFVDGRNAIIQADMALNGGANVCLIWQVFARRGLGFSASQGLSSSRSDGTQAFDLPPSCIGVATPSGVLASDGTFNDKVRVTWNGNPGNWFRVYRNTTNDSGTAAALGSWQNTTTYDDASAVAGTTYHYWVRAASDNTGANISAFSTGDTGFRATSGPTVTVPASVQASDGTFTDKVRVTWTGTSGNWFRVYRNTTNDSGTSTALGSWQNTTTYDDASAVAGTTYHYWVRASSDNTGANISAFSTGDAGFRALPPGTVTIPTNVQATDGAFSDKVQITWSGTSGNWFRVFRSTSNNSSRATALGNWQTGMTFDDSTVPQGTTFWYFVRAAADNAGANTSAFSTGDSGFRTFGGPTVTVPANVQATDGTFTDKVRVTWTGTSGNWFRVYRNTTNDSGTSTALGSWQNTTTYDDASAVAGTTYHYWVRAASDNTGANISAFSTGDTGFRATSGPVVTVPASVQASDGTFTDKVQVTWTGTAGNWFRVYRNTTNDSGTATALGSWQNTTTYDDASAVAGTTYHYWVRAASDNSGANISAFSTGDTGFRATSGPMVTVPASVQASDGTFTDKVQVTWTGTSGNWFRVYRNTTNDSGTATALGSWQNTTTYDDASAVAGTTYHYWVRAASDNSGANISAFSTGDTGFRASPPGTVTVPANVQASDGTFSDRVRVTWTGTSGNWFRVYRSNTNNISRSTALGSWQNTMSYDDFTPNVGTTYFYWVRAASDNGGSNISAFSTGNSGFRVFSGSIINNGSNQDQVKSVENILQVFPNPANTSSNFIINSSLMQEADGNIIILDVAGKIVKELRYSADQKIFIETPEKPGIFIVMIKSDNGKSESARFIVD